MYERCSPVEMRKNITASKALQNAGIDFVPIACKNDKHKAELIEQGNKALEEILKQVEEG